MTGKTPDRIKDEQGYRKALARLARLQRRRSELIKSGASDVSTSYQSQKILDQVAEIKAYLASKKNEDTLSSASLHRAAWAHD